MSSHETATILGALAVVFVLARLGGSLVARAKLPSVLGELGVGVLLGSLVGHDSLFHQSELLHLVGEIGIVVLLFEVGLESSLRELARVGPQAAAVAVVGILLPVTLGTALSYFLAPGVAFVVHLFTGATLAATSIGLTMRILRDLDLTKTKEAKIVLGAAVLDDLLGLVLLALVTSAARATDAGSGFSVGELARLLGVSLLFVVVAVAIGRVATPPVLKMVARFFGAGSPLVFGMAMCFGYCYLADLFDLAPVIGAFFAGLAIPTRQLIPTSAPGEATLEDQLRSLSRLFVPVFFVLTGAQVDVARFADPSIFVLAGALTVAAIVGKVAAGYVARKPLDRLLIGVSMVPRGEVGLIFASIGLGIHLDGKPLFSQGTFGAIIAMVAITSIVSPLWLSALIRHRARQTPAEEAAT